MTYYKGYYIDGISFTCKAEIDSFLKEQAIRSYKTAIKLFCSKGSLEASIYADQKAEYLHKQFGMDWNEIEAIEIEVMKAA